MTDVKDTEQRRAEEAEHEEPYHYDAEHDNNGRALNGSNHGKAPEWWPKGKGHSPRPYVKWGSRYAREPAEDEHISDRILAQAGVNVEGESLMTEALPLPWFDKTQYSHGLQQGRDPAKSAEHFWTREAKSDRNLREHGISVDRDPFLREEDQGQEDKLVLRKPCSYVDSGQGMQSHVPYFATFNDKRSDRASDYKLEHEGVLLENHRIFKAIPDPGLAPYDHTRDDGCDQGDNIDARASAHKLPEGEMDVEMQEPLGTNTFVNIFSPQYHGPGAKHLPVEDTVA